MHACNTPSHTWKLGDYFCELRPFVFDLLLPDERAGHRYQQVRVIAFDHGKHFEYSPVARKSEIEKNKTKTDR